MGIFFRPSGFEGEKFVHRQFLAQQGRRAVDVLRRNAHRPGKRIKQFAENPVQRQVKRGVEHVADFQQRPIHQGNEGNKTDEHLAITFMAHLETVARPVGNGVDEVCVFAFLLPVLPCPLFGILPFPETRFSEITSYTPGAGHQTGHDELGGQVHARLRAHIGIHDEDAARDTGQAAAHGKPGQFALVMPFR